MVSVSSPPYREPQSDANKPTDTKTRLGQVFTPANIADRMAVALSSRMKTWQDAVICEPCVGEGALLAALHRAGACDYTLVGCERDPVLAARSGDWVRDVAPPANPIHAGDFLTLELPNIGRWDGAIANPPYIRQEWITDKSDYISRTRQMYGVTIPGSANLYVHFIVRLVLGLRPGGVLCVLVYDSWTHTRYGRWLVDFLNEYCTDMESIPVANAPFEGHLIDATILVGRRAEPGKPTGEKLVLESRSRFAGLTGMAPLRTLYQTRRGLRLKQAAFFMGTAEDIASCGATRFAKKPGRLSGLSVRVDHPESALLRPLQGAADPRLIAELERRLAATRQAPERNRSVLNWVEKRPEIWDRHPPAPKAPLLFGYAFRTRPRHFLNPHNIPYADNYYGLTPLVEIPHLLAFALLNSTFFASELLACSRSQGSGLMKLQLFEYREAWTLKPDTLTTRHKSMLMKLGDALSHATTLEPSLIVQIDRIIHDACDQHPALAPDRLAASHPLLAKGA